METINNDIFRLVNLRRPLESIAIDPDEDETVEDTDGPVITALRDGSVFPGISGTAIPNDIERAISELESATLTSPLREMAEHLRAEPAAFSGFSGHEEITYGDNEQTFAELAALPAFRTDYAAAYNVWLIAKLSDRKSVDLTNLENQLRVGYLIYKLAKGGGSKESALGGRTLPTVPIRLPSTVRTRVTRDKNAAATAAAKKQKKKSEPDALTQLNGDYETLDRQIHVYDAIERKLNDSLTALSTPDLTSVDDEIIEGKSSPGLLGRISGFLFGRRANRTQKSRSLPAPEFVDAGVIAKMKETLTEEEDTALNQALAGLGSRPTVEATIKTVSDAKGVAILAANHSFTQLLNADTHGRFHLPEPTNDDVIIENGAVQALGWGDLIVAKETLFDYEAREIAHIENILPNERKGREHTRSKTVEETLETEVIEEEESQRELETTTRHELQTESEKAIDQEFSIQSGVNTSGRYGLTKVETSLDAGFSRSTQESQSTTTNIAKEIVSKAVERTFKAVRELRRRTVTTEIVEINKHEIDNVPVGGGNATSISGIYKWVEKVHEIQLRHYGTRMMIEFSVPEPALSIVGKKDDIDVGMDEPEPPWFDASGIGSGNYLALAARFKAVGISPPPDAFIHVGFAWSSQPSESDDENKSEDVLSELIPIPADYRPTSGRFNVSAHPSQENYFQIRLQIADKQFPMDGDATFGQWFFLTGGGVDASWPDGVPVSMTAHGHFDKTLSMNIMFVCYRRTVAWREWQIETFDAIRTGYERQRQEYDEAVENARLQQGVQNIPTGTPGAVNRRTEREELQKWSTKILRRTTFEFDAVVKIGANTKSHNEIDPGRADQQAAIVRFYQEAFEWDNMSYFFYPYFWGRRDAWNIRQSLQHTDYRFETFLRAGASRVIVPVTPGYEAKILFYLANQDLPENERIKGPDELDPTSGPPDSVAESVYDTMWLELMLNKNEELALGSGFLDVAKNRRDVGIVESTWSASDRDIRRELFIAGNRYEIDSVVDTSNIRLTEEYQGDDDSRAAYATGSVAFGPPWVVNLPTNLVVLHDNKDKIRLQ